MKLGPRVIKTGIAVTLALYICSLLNLESAVFAGMAAIFTIQPSIYRTWKQVWNQVQTNLLGAIIALIGLHFLGNDPFSIGLVMIIVIVISLKLKMADSHFPYISDRPRHHECTWKSGFDSLLYIVLD